MRAPKNQEKTEIQRREREKRTEMVGKEYRNGWAERGGRRGEKKEEKTSGVSALCC